MWSLWPIRTAILTNSNWWFTLPFAPTTIIHEGWYAIKQKKKHAYIHIKKNNTNIYIYIYIYIYIWKMTKWDLFFNIVPLQSPHFFDLCCNTWNQSHQQQIWYQLMNFSKIHTYKHINTHTHMNFKEKHYKIWLPAFFLQADISFAKLCPKHQNLKNNINRNYEKITTKW